MVLYFPEASPSSSHPPLHCNNHLHYLHQHHNHIITISTSTFSSSSIITLQHHCHCHCESLEEKESPEHLTTQNLLREGDRQSWSWEGAIRPWRPQSTRLRNSAFIQKQWEPWRSSQLERTQRDLCLGRVLGSSQREGTEGWWREAHGEVSPSVTNQGSGPGLQQSRQEWGVGNLRVEAEAGQRGPAFPVNPSPCPTSVNKHSIPDCPTG